LRLLLALYRRHVWHVSGGLPELPQFVVIGAPHTSNWDFITFLGVTEDLGVHASFIGKHSLFRWPLATFMREIGGIPVNRKAPGKNYVEQVVAEFSRRERLVLVISPEGTRSEVSKWRTGFYRIALGAGVPIVPAWLDRATHRAGFGSPIMPSGDYAADLAAIAGFYRSVMPDDPKLAVLYRETGLADQ